MIELLRKNNRLNEAWFIVISSIVCLGFSIFRVAYTDSKMFLFLNWNLFLAIIPWVLSSMVMLKPKVQSKKRTLILLLFTWLIFFPNAPYIFTDLFHLRGNLTMPIWFDLVLILSFAWLGLILGFLSLWDIEKLLLKWLSKKQVSIISSCLLFLSGFGIYLGRYLRFNSWDIVNNPVELMYDVGDRVVNPFDHPRAWGMTLFIGVFLNMIYWSLKLMRNREILLSK
jgi:uncharacterized membrane protein